MGGSRIFSTLSQVWYLTSVTLQQDQDKKGQQTGGGDGEEGARDTESTEVTFLSKFSFFFFISS